MSSSNVAVQTVSTELPATPLTLEGLSVLHQMFRFRWPEWRKLDPSRQADIAREAAAVFSASEEAGQSALYSMLGHKGDLMIVHFRDSFDELNAAELQLNRTVLQDFLEPVHSYLSVIELGLYDSSVKLFRQLTERGVKPLSKEWNDANRRNTHAPARSHAPAAVSQNSRQPLPVFLSHGPQAR